MNRKTLRAPFFAAILVAAFSVGRPAAAQSHHDRKPEDPFRLQKLTSSVYVLYGRGGNVGFFVGPDAVVVVDSQFKDLAPGIVKQIKSVTDKPIKYLLNTHHHGDHTGGNEVFFKFAVIVAHDNVRKRMLASPADILKTYPARLEEARKKGDKDSVQRLEEQIAWAQKVRVEEIPAPVLTFDSEFRIHIAPAAGAGADSGETIDVWHTPPSHTDGDSVVYFQKANVLHMGDDFFNKVIPVIDVSAGGSPRGYLTAIDKVIARVPANVVIIPGHGEVSDLNGLKAFRKYIQEIVDLAQNARASGKSKEEFLAAAELVAYKDWNGYGSRLASNLAAAFDEGR